jgi:hypothetical protein
MFDRCVGLSLSRGERVWRRILFCSDEKLGCIAEGDYTALTLVEMIDRRVGLSLSRGERVWGRILFWGDEKLGAWLTILATINQRQSNLVGDLPRVWMKLSPVLK